MTLSFMSSKVKNGVSEIDGRPGWFRIHIDGEETGSPVRGFARAMSTYRSTKGISQHTFADGVEGGLIPGTLNHQQ